jgi:asparagine synthase (glutamine-hydrolysing)
MCGIAGLVAPVGEAPDRRRLHAMTTALAHRGPDADGYLVDDNVGLGHRRLSVIDTREVANQPLFSEDGSVAVIFNGEIYNFRDLVAELETAGHTFVTRTDTEVLVHGWEEWGEGLVPRLRGMFVFALWDRRRRVLFLARDRMGKKPLHYSHDPARPGFAFASEIGALRVGADAGNGPALGDLDLAAVGEYLVYGNTVGERTVFRSIRRLPPGCTLAFHPDRPERPPVVRRYWTYRPEGGEAVERAGEGLDPVAYLEELEARLTEATRLRLMSDVPLGAFLSGGVDSSLIVALMARESSGPVSTFAIGFEEEAWNEAPHARAVAEYLGTDHHEEIVTQDALAMLPELVATYDEPFGDPSAIPTWHLARMTRRHVTVALSGDGGDELFYGYTRYRETATLDRLGRRVTPAGRWAARKVGGLLPVDSWAARAVDRGGRRGHDGFDLYHHAMGWSEPFLSMLRPVVRDALGSAEEQSSAGDFHRGVGLELLERAQQMDLGNYLPDQVLVKVDRAAMQHSLEVRCPLLDAEVVDWAARAPADLQMEHGGKALLKSLAYRYVPRHLLDRPKQGFAVPLREWFRGELAPKMADALADDDNLAWRCFDRQEARRRFDRHRAGKADNETVLWRLLFFSEWARQAG